MSYGTGLSSGNGTVPFDTLNADNSRLNASIPDDAG